jgi:hypothetical protein
MSIFAVWRTFNGHYAARSVRASAADAGDGKPGMIPLLRITTCLEMSALL